MEELVRVMQDPRVRYRLPDGRHVLLFNGHRGDPPLKVSAARPPGDSLKYLRQWTRNNRLE